MEFQSSDKEVYNQGSLEAMAKPVFFNGVIESPPIQLQVPERRILGLRRATFFLSVALLALIIAAGVGGGVGGSLSVKNAETRCLANAELSKALGTAGRATATMTVTTTLPLTTGTITDTTIPFSSNPAAATTTPPSQPDTATTGTRIVVPTTGLLPLDCPSLTGKNQTVDMKTTIVRFQLLCSVDLRVSNANILAVTAYSLTDCLRACASFNLRSSNANKECQGVVFNSELSQVEDHFGTCFLKRSSGGRVGETDPGKINSYVAGILIV
ncbi:hypothetical protein B0H63DRAFT_318830 [Podospora didyma]|uniref:Apple domain-containing protein n=1 Tax=Podospora didyma TaxID=330526 RepID=A0AAE0N4N0_9PEZI|nr:hypothetical protein B0H63DRAFT_318830 [Podospora didyma]